MIGVSRRILFAVEAVLEIACTNENGEPVRSADITEREGIPRRYLEPVLQELVRDGILVSVRGPSGGYLLNRKADAISVGDVVRTVRALDTRDDPLQAPGSALAQAVRPMWVELERAAMRRLDSITIADLCLIGGAAP